MAGKPEGGLSSEQIQRMEENRRQAQQRLSNKRALAAVGSTTQAASWMGSTATPFTTRTPQSSEYGPPPAKRPAVNLGPSVNTNQHQPHEQKIIGPPSLKYGQSSSAVAVRGSGAASAFAVPTLSSQKVPNGTDCVCVCFLGMSLVVEDDNGS